MNKSITLTFFLIAAAVASAGQAKVQISRDDIKVLEGPKWIGELTYLDYGSKKTVKIRSNVTITRSAADPLAWTFAFEYPDEPKADRTSEVKLSADGTVFDDENVVQRRKLPDGTLSIVTTADGTDDNRKALIRHTYLISKKRYSVTKEVRFEGTEEYIKRNSSEWSR